MCFTLINPQLRFNMETWRKFEEWFDLKFGWFFTNGYKAEEREKMLHEKFNTRTEHQPNNKQ